jgi:hypothetical protein
MNKTILFWQVKYYKLNTRKNEGRVREHDEYLRKEAMKYFLKIRLIVIAK